MHRPLETIPASAESRQGAPGLQTYQVQVINNLADIARLKTEWLALEAASPGVTLFQSYEWCRNNAEHAITHGERGFMVLTVRRGPLLVGLLPLRTQTKKLRTVLSGMSEPFQQYTEMLVAPGHDANAVFAPMLAAIRQSGADFLYLGQVRHGGSLHSAIDGTMDITGEHKAAPFVPLGEFADFDSYFKSLNSKTRKNMRNARNRLGRVGELTHEVATGGPLLDEVIERTFSGRTQWLERMGLTSRAFRNAGFENFVGRFKSDEDPGVTAMAFSLKLDGKPIAEQWGFVFRERYYAFISTFDTEYEAFSPGKLHLEDVLRACSADGIKVADFMVPSLPYKLTYAPEVADVDDYVLPLTLTGRLYGGLWVRHLRPLAKSIAYAIPDDLRKSLISRLYDRNDTGK